MARAAKSAPAALSFKEPEASASAKNGRSRPRKVEAVSEPLTPAQEYANKIKPLMPEARTAFGSQAPGSPPRIASDKVNDLVLEYANAGNKMPALASELEGVISLSGLRRRVRLARASVIAGPEAGALGSSPRKRGDTDPEKVRVAAERIAKARETGGRTYGDAVRKAYDDGLALQAIADHLGVSYFCLWAAKRSSY